MALLCRIKQAKPNHLSHHFKRFYFQIPVPSLPTSKGLSNFCYDHILKPKHMCMYPTPAAVFGDGVRFYAAPVQFQKKVEVKEPKGLRLNEQIKVEFVRLVTDEGHGVVSRREALQRAKNLKLDLVEVDRDAKPPVCKIMDYHKERYMKQVREKERAKIKSQGSLKKGDCKEVRFSAKTELKDLKMKADMAKRLMERGYRVKCMTTGTEDQDLSGLLSQLSAMLEDVAFVETGPRVERKQAYFIVRHVKFGPSKKGGKKASNVATSSETQEAVTASADLAAASCSEDSDMDNDEELDAPSQGQEEATWSVPDSRHDFDKTFDPNHDVKCTGSYADVKMKFDAGAASCAANTDVAGLSRSGPPNFRTPNVGPSSQETENRYARNMKNNASNRQSEPRSNFSAPVGRSGPAATAGSQGSNRQSEPRSKFSAPVGRSDPATSAGSRGSPLTGFGIFSASKTDSSGKHESAVEANRYSRGNSNDVRRNSGPGNPATVKSDGSQGTGADDSGKYGIFSRGSSNSTPRIRPDSN